MDKVIHPRCRVLYNVRYNIPMQSKNYTWLYMLEIIIKGVKYYKIGSSKRVYERVYENYRECQADDILSVKIIEPNEENDEKDIHNLLKKAGLKENLVIEGKNKREIYRYCSKTATIFNSIRGEIKAVRNYQK